MSVSFKKKPTGYFLRFPDASLFFLMLSWLVYLGNVYRYHLERWDDAYIAFRFAQRVAGGEGLIWNAGGERVEGFTSLLDVLLLAAGFKFGIEPQLWSLIIGIAAVLATAFMMTVIVRRLTGDFTLIAALLIGIYLIDVNTAIHTTSGLETQLFTTVLCACLVLAFSFVETPRRSTAIALGWMIFLSCMCRPEAVICGTALYFALGVFCARRNSRDLFLKLAASISVTAALGAVYAAWKYHYFGYILPNPYYVKSGNFSVSGAPEVADFLRHLFGFIAPVAAVGLLLILTGKLKMNRAATEPETNAETTRKQIFSNDSASKFLLLLTPPTFALCFYATIIHEVGGAHRFSYPTYFYFVLAAAVFSTNLFERFQITKFDARILIFVAAACFIWMFYSQKSWRVEPIPPGEFNRYHLKIAAALGETNLGSKATVLCDAAGIIPFVSGFNQIDRVGLVDNFLSGRTPATAAEREAYLWNQSADVYIGYEPPASREATAPKNDAAFQSPYVSQILLKRKLTLVESRVFLQDAPLLDARMRELRDRWILVGELDFPGWQAWHLKSFAYVRRDSPYAETLVSKLDRITKLKLDQINLDDIGER